ncbi:MAG: DUF3006 domain-containing protein [Saccharofermentanales bacterium]
MKVVIDRFESGYAILEMPDTTMVAAPAVLFENAEEGDVFTIVADLTETRERKEKIAKMMKDVWADE